MAAGVIGTAEGRELKVVDVIRAVSYTHLDVYKRQVLRTGHLLGAVQDAGHDERHLVRILHNP